MTVEEELEMHRSIKEHWLRLGIEETRKRQKLYREAVKLSSDLAIKCVRCPEGTTGKIILLALFRKAEARLQRRTVAYFGE